LEETKVFKWILWGLIGIVVSLFTIFPVLGHMNNVPVLQEEVNSSWGQVQNVYQRRADLIPNLVEVVKGYATHENQTLTAVIEARAKASQVTLPKDILQNPELLKKFQANQDSLGAAIGRLMIVVEKYPDLKANENFLQLQSQLEGTENRITVERQRFVEAVRQYNTEVRTFPGLLWARLVWDAQPMPQFEASPNAKEAPKVNFK
jgi:LemA protein